jgi:hypothetical protein
MRIRIRDPEYCQSLIRDSGWKKPHLGFGIKHPGSATLPSIVIILMLLVGNVDVLHVLKWYRFVCVVGHACGGGTASGWLGSLTSGRQVRLTSSGLVTATASERKNPSHQDVNRVCQICKSSSCLIIYVTRYLLHLESSVPDP